jgi:fructokinase
VIVVAGDALMDLVVGADDTITALPGGGPYNAARAIGRLGLAVWWLGGLSSDPFGRRLETRLDGDGVSLGLVQRTDAPTTLAVAEPDAAGDVSYRFYTDGTSAALVEPGPLSAGLPESTRGLHVGTFGLVFEPIASTLEAVVAGLAPDVLLLVDPNCRPSAIHDAEAYRARLERILRRADVVKASTDDLAFLRPDEDAEAAAEWIASLGVRVVLVTAGAAPVTVIAGGVAARVAIPPVRVVDTIGAGDTFGGAALAWLVHEGVSRQALDGPVAIRAARFGVRAAAITCSRPGADPPTLEELGGWESA